MPEQADDGELPRLLALARAATPIDRITFRDPIARQGPAAILAIAPWLTNPVLGAFAVRTISAAGSRGARGLAIETLREALSAVQGTPVERDMLDEIARLESASRATTETTQSARGATIAGAPKADTQYSPPLSAGERELIDTLGRLLPEGWTIFVRPHLDGDRPAVALLHRKRGAMIWDVRDIDLSGVKGSPKNYRDRDGVPYLDPIDRINAIRRRLYREYVPGWAEAIDKDHHAFGVVRTGVDFPTATSADLVRLELRRRHEKVVGQGGLRGCAIEDLVPNASRDVQFEPSWHDALYQRFSEYHPPTFALIQPTKRQQELIDDPAAPGWRGLEGVAGSGKSLVLARRATRLVREGRRVLLVTYNVTLANYCRALVEDAPDRFERSQIVVQHFHGLCSAILRNLNLPAPLHPAGRDRDVDGPPADPEKIDARTHDHYDQAWPDAVIVAVKHRALPAEFTFDAILVDEAQDFGPAFFDVLAELMRDDGEVLLAFDRAQRLYARADAIAGRLDMRRVKKLNGSRRLKQRHASIASDLGASRRMPTERIELDDGMPALFADDDAQWATVPDTATALAVARRVLEEWRMADGYRTDGTAVLVGSNAVGRALVELLREGDIETNHIFPEGPGQAEGRRHKLAFVPHDQRVKVATIHSFKGWEADDVVVVEPPSGGELAAAQMYVALTRAKSRMVVVASSDLYQLRRYFDALDTEPDPMLVGRAADLMAQAGSAPGRPDRKPETRRQERRVEPDPWEASRAPASTEPGPPEPPLWEGEMVDF